MRHKTVSIEIFTLIFINFLIFKCFSSNSSCLLCKSNLFRTCYDCWNKFPDDTTHIEKISIICNNSILNLFQEQQRFYSIIKSYTSVNCTVKTLYLDQFTLWNYLESMSITYARLTNLSPVIFNRSLSFTPVLYSVKTLNLSHNSLSTIDKNFSFYFPSLEILDLSYNQLRIIKKHTFNNFILLKELYLNDNLLKQISFTIFPRQLLRFINLNSNHWHCTCKNVFILSISRPIPNCHTPLEYRKQNAGDLARQCFLYTKAIILITIDKQNKQNLTCTLSSTIDIWKNKLNPNTTILSIWHIEQNRPISIEYLSNSNDHLEKYLICFDLNSTNPESIHTIIPIQTMNNTYKQNFIKRNSSSVFISTFDKRTHYHFIIPLMLIISILILCLFATYLIYQKYRKQAHYTINSHSNQCTDESDAPRTIFNCKLNCQNSKCLCQYRREGNKSKNNNIQPLLIEPIELRYAKIKQINNRHSSGEFRTIVKLKSLPS